MTEFNSEQTIVIQAPVEKVYAYISDFPRHVEWNYQLNSMTKTTSGPVGIDSIFRSKERSTRETSWLMKLLFPWLGKLMGTTGYTEAEITALDTNRRVAWTATAPLKKGGLFARAEWEICLQPQGQATLVTQRVYFQLLHKMVARMDPEKLSQETGAEMSTNLGQLKAILEPQAEAQAAGGRPAFI